MPQLVQLFYVMPDGTNGTVALDASVSEQHGVQAQVTEHQVESGTNVTDYIRPMPRRLSITGLVTNTPIATPTTQNRGVTGQTSTFTGQDGTKWKALQFTGEFDRVRDVYGVLVDAALAGATFQVVTTLENYQSLAITNLVAPRDADHGNAVQFQIDFQEIRVVDSQTVQALPKSISKTHKGKQAGKQLDDSDAKATKARSILSKLLN